MLRHPLSDDELRVTFAQQLARVLKGRGVLSDTGLDDETNAALEQVTPNANPALIATAKAEFGRQLDGTHAQARSAAMETALERAFRT